MKYGGYQEPPNHERVYFEELLSKFVHTKNKKYKKLKNSYLCSMKVSRKGVTRIVLLIGSYAIKFPNPLYCHSHFLQGCYANWSERQLTKRFNIYQHKISPTFFCAWFGLFSVQRRVLELNRDLSSKEVEYFKELTSDIKKENFGWLEERLVCVDYV